MSSPAIATVIKMMESLSEDVQEERVAEHLREYLEDLQDELKWNKSFKKTQQQLIASAQSAKREIAEGLAKPSLKQKRQ
jgi:DNA-binding transcriptional regulator GbsR (MarR family)